MVGNTLGRWSLMWVADVGRAQKGAGVSDMTLLSTISNESINDNLKKRFENAEIYTYIGHVLISSVSVSLQLCLLRTPAD